MSTDVFEEAEWWVDFSNHAKHIWPEVSWVFASSLFSCNTKGLAGIARSDAIHNATPWFAVEGFKICPNRRRIQGVFCHARCQDGTGKGFDLDKTDGASIWLRHAESKVESPDAGAQGQNGKGTWIHTGFP
jgi:hypothetical protein